MFFYTVKDWSLNPQELHNLSLREVIAECTALEDEEIKAVANLMIGESFEGCEFSITCTEKSA